MYQLLIVDDEPSVVDAIAHTFPWSDLNISEVYCAYSANEALKIADQTFIDILLTDIRMPGMDGLQLIEKIRGKSQRTECILLTGYAEFEYAKMALQLQAADYLLKPVSDEKLTEAIIGVTKRLTEKWEQIASQQRTLRIFRNHLPALQSDVLRHLLEGRMYGAGELDEKLSALEVPFYPGKPVHCVLVRLDNQFAKFSNGDRYLSEYAILNMVEEIFGNDFDIWSCKDSHDYLALILGEKGTGKPAGVHAELVSRLCSQLQHLVFHYFQGHISIVIGQFGYFPDELPQLYELSVKTMRRRIGNGRGLLLSAANSEPAGDVRPMSHLHEPPSLIHLFEGGMWEEAVKKLNVVFAKLEQNGDESIELPEELYHTVAAACFHYAHSNGKTLQELLGDREFERLFASSEKWTSISALKEWAMSICERLSRENQDEIQDARNHVIRQVQEYIHAHLSNDVSLQTLADQVALHPVYLSKIYKLETGEGLKEYLFRVRMEKAVHLLLNSELKIYEITAQVGYLNTAYFIKVFKNQFGQTPQEYRDENR